MMTTSARTPDRSAPDALDAAVRDALAALPKPEDAHDRRGFVTSGNTRALKDGTTSPRLLDALEPIRVALVHQVLADRGVTERDAMATEHEAAKSFARLAAMEELMWQHVRRLGFTTAKGRVSAASNKLLVIIERKLRAAALLGFERRPRAVASLSDLLGHTVAAPAVMAATDPEAARAPAGDADEGDA